MVSEAQKRNAARYQAANTKMITIRVNKKLEPELLEWIESKSSKSKYILDLIRDDMRKNK
jgi:hypothetical protein